MRSLALRKSGIVALVLMALIPGTALAATLSLDATYMNLRLSSPGASLTKNLPGVQIRLRQDLGNKWSDALTLSGSTSQSFTAVNAGFSVGKAFSAGPIWLRPAIHLQGNWVSIPGLSFRTVDAGLGLHAFYPITSKLTAYVSVSAGETFDNHLSLTVYGPLKLAGSTTGGLTYGGSAGLGYAVGPGVVSLGYHYQRTPIAPVLKMTTGQAELGYRISF